MSHEVLMGSGDRKTVIGERLVESTGGWSVINNGRFLSVTNAPSSLVMLGGNPGENYW